MAEPMASGKQIALRKALGAAGDTVATRFDLRSRGLADRFQVRPESGGRPAESSAARTVPWVCPVLLVGESPILLAGLGALLAREAGFRVVGETILGDAWQQAVAPDGIVVFAVAAWTDAIAEAVAELRAAHPGGRAVLLVADADPERMRQFLAGGGFAAMPMRAQADAVLAVIRSAHPALASAPAGNESGPAPASVLSAREERVLRSKVSGHTNKAIAAELNLSVKTVETYYTRGMGKLSLHSRAEMVQYAMTQGWLTES